MRGFHLNFRTFCERVVVFLLTLGRSVLGMSHFRSHFPANYCIRQLLIQPISAEEVFQPLRSPESTQKDRKQSLLESLPGVDSSSFSATKSRFVPIPFLLQPITQQPPSLPCSLFTSLHQKKTTMGKNSIKLRRLTPMEESQKQLILQVCLPKLLIFVSAIVHLTLLLFCSPAPIPGLT